MGPVKKVVAIISCAVFSIGLAGCPKRRVQQNGFQVTVQSYVVIAGIVPFYTPLQGIDVSGFRLYDLEGATGSTTTFNRLTDADGEFFVPYGRYPAVWRSVVIDPHDPPVCFPNIADYNVTRENPRIEWFCPEIVSVPNPQFSLTSAVPPNLTVSSPNGGFRSENGMPYLNLYGPEGQFVSKTTSASLASDGTSATFPFPSQSDGSPLAVGLYGFNAWNPDPSAGVPQIVGAGFLSLGSADTSRPTPFGVDVYKVEDSWERCEDIPDMGWYCYSGNSQNTEPIITLSSTGQIADGVGTISVGAEPIAIRAFRVESTTQENGGYTWYERYTTTRATRALVANFGSNSVSIMDLVNRTPLANISVGTNPTAVVITGDESKAYVANSGSGTISEVNLIGLSQTRQSWVGMRPTALAMDPSGTSLWVGGEGYVAKVDLSNLAVVSSFPVSGLVTSLALSPGQGTLLYTTVSNTTTTASGQARVTAGSSFSVKETRVSDYTVVGSYGSASSSTGSYQAAADGASVPGLLLAGGCLVSANYGNSIAVAATPTGFIVIDLYNHSEIMSGSTPSPVRGIATDPGQGVVYLTAPQSNALISVPLPPVQQ